jgi:hypothetical protein
MVKVADKGSEADRRALVASAIELWPSETARPATVIFDGDLAPEVDDSSTARLLLERAEEAFAIVGRPYELGNDAVVVRLVREHGRNIAVFGSKMRDVLGVAALTAVRSMSARDRACGGDGVRVVLIDGDETAERETQRLADVLRGAGASEVAVVLEADSGAYLKDLADALSGDRTAQVPSLILIVEADSSDALAKMDQRALCSVFEQGPPRGCHVIASWSSADAFERMLGLRSRGLAKITVASRPGRMVTPTVGTSLDALAWVTDDFVGPGPKEVIRFAPISSPTPAGSEHLGEVR